MTRELCRFLSSSHLPSFLPLPAILGLVSPSKVVASFVCIERVALYHDALPIAPLQKFDRDINPFRPTGPFMAPKVIILIKYLSSFLLFNRFVLVFLYAEEDVNLAWQSCLGLKN